MGRHAVMIRQAASGRTEALLLPSERRCTVCPNARMFGLGQALIRMCSCSVAIRGAASILASAVGEPGSPPADMLDASSAAPVAGCLLIGRLDCRDTWVLRVQRHGWWKHLAAEPWVDSGHELAVLPLLPFLGTGGSRTSA